MIQVHSSPVLSILCPNFEARTSGTSILSFGDILDVNMFALALGLVFWLQCISMNLMDPYLT